MTEYRKTCNNSIKNMKYVHECVIKLFDKNEFCNVILQNLGFMNV